MRYDQRDNNDAAENWLHRMFGDNFQPDVPADAWQRLEPHLPRPKERRLPIWRWLLLSGVISALCFFYPFKPRAVSFPSTPDVQLVAQHRSDPRPYFGENSPCKLNHSDRGRQYAEPGASAGFSSEKPVALRLNNPENSAVSQQKAPDALSVITPLQSALPSGELFLPSLPTLPEPLPRIPAPFRFLRSGPMQPLLQLSSTAPPIKPNRRKRFWLGVEIAPMLSFPQKTPPAQTGLAFIGKPTQTTPAWQTGLTMSFSLSSNWQVGLGLQHFSQLHTATHTAVLRLMDGVCINPNASGLKEYEFQYTLISDGGAQSNLALRLQQQDKSTTMSSDEPFILDMKTVHQLSAWRIPLSIERRFGGHRQCGFVRGGAVFGVKQHSKTQVTHYSESCEDLCFQNGHVPVVQTVSNTSPFTVGWFIGGGIERALSPRIALRVEPYLTGKKKNLQGGLSIGMRSTIF